jgi:short-subunit dehydrogenase
VSRRRIAGSTAVVVGATSGIGRAVTISLVRSGANVVFMARSAADVRDLAHDCQGFGPGVIGEEGDVARSEDVERLTRTAIGAFGHIDTWINTASGLVVGDLVDQPPADIIRLVQTNLVGTALASRAALSHFRERDAGVLINVSSLLGLVPNPLAPTYVMTKFAVRGLSLSLHEATTGTGVRVCTVLPGPVDTPMFQHAANYSGRLLRAIPPAFSPERVAAAVLRSAKRPRRQRTVGLTGALIMIGHHVAPRLVETTVARAAAALVVRSGTAEPTAGSVHRSAGPAQVTGGWRRLAARARAGDEIGRYLARRRARSGQSSRGRERWAPSS